MEKSAFQKFSIIVVVMVIYLLAFSFAKADIVPENQKNIDYCTKISNISSFPNLSVVLYVQAVDQTYSNTQIKENTCLDKGYKFNTAKLLATRTDYLETINFQNKNLLDDAHFIGSNLAESEITTAKQVSKNDNTQSIQTTYVIDGFANNQLILGKDEESITYVSGTPGSISKFSRVKPDITTVDVNQVIAFDTSSPSPSVSPSPTPSQTSNGGNSLASTGLPLTIMLIVVVVAVIIGVVYFVIIVTKRS